MYTIEKKAKKILSKIGDILYWIGVSAVLLFLVGILVFNIFACSKTETTTEFVTATVTKMEVGAEGKHTKVVYIVAAETEDGYADMFEISAKDYATLNVGDTIKLKKIINKNEYKLYNNCFYEYEGI